VGTGGWLRDRRLDLFLGRGVKVDGWRGRERVFQGKGTGKAVVPVKVGRGGKAILVEVMQVISCYFLSDSVSPQEQALWLSRGLITW